MTCDELCWSWKAHFSRMPAGYASLPSATGDKNLDMLDLPWQYARFAENLSPVWPHKRSTALALHNVLSTIVCHF
jgi:hypothetical protein